MEEPTIPMMSGINDMFSENQYLQNPSSITMPLPIQSIPVNQSMIPFQQLPMSLGPVISTTQPVSQLSQFIQSVDPLVLEQSSVDGHPVQQAVVLQESVKQESIKTEGDAKNVTFHLCQPNEEQTVDDRNEMDVKRVKECLYSV